MDGQSGCLHCNICKRNYASYKSLWNHNDKFHREKEILFGISGDTLSISNSTRNKMKENIKSKCEFCSREFNHRTNKYKHIKICKAKKEKELKEDIKNMILEVLNKEGKIHHNTLKKINKNLINSNNTTTNNNNNITNTVNNITNNNIQVVQFGKENISDLLTQKELITIFNHRAKCLEESIRLVHFNKERKQFRNIYITNLKDDVAYIYNGDYFQAVNKLEILKELIDNHYDNIYVKFEDYKKRLNPNTVKAIEQFIQEMNDENIQVKDEKSNRIFKNYRYYKINEIKLLIYNQKDNKIPTNVINLVCEEDNEEDEQEKDEQEKDEQEEEKKIIDI